MSAVTLRWLDNDNLAVLVDGRTVVTASNNTNPNSTPDHATVVAFAVIDVAKALGVQVSIERAGK